METRTLNPRFAGLIWTHTHFTSPKTTATGRRTPARLLAIAHQQHGVVDALPLRAGGGVDEVGGARGAVDALRVPHEVLEMRCGALVRFPSPKERSPFWKAKNGSPVG